MGLVLCLGLSGVLSLFYQNKLDDVSLYGWMLQKGSFVDVPDVRGSLISFIIVTDMFTKKLHNTKTTLVPLK
jgi:hypothetical protein